ncbi:hypothetical protein G9U52_12045 [Paenibacillus sp. S3N08]|uniref:Interferon-induced transmembrane protein n=2 Tax=Paenibacillus agricola TaxID=2716264 RepID=A0ABX0J3K2_9BACL|nr:hypothetical protein [Paenibacillus agricola]
MLNKPSSANNYQDSYAPQAPVLTVKDWLLTLIVGIIPIVNIVMLFVWAFGGNANPNKSNYAKATLIIAAVVIVLYILAIIAFLLIFGMAGISSGMFDDFQ